MKVVHLLPALEQGGVETVVCDLVKMMGGGLPCRSGEVEKWESVVISKGGRLEERIAAAGGRHIALDLKSKSPLTYFARAWKLRRILRRERPDLVCVHSRVPAWLFVWANRGLGLKWITYAHGANSVSRYSAVMTKGDLIIVPSRFLADYLKANYGTPDKKIRVIPNSVDAERFNPENLDQAFIAEKKREWGIREGDRVIMAIGRITPVKGLEELIRNFPTLTSEVIAKPSTVPSASSPTGAVTADRSARPLPAPVGETPTVRGLAIASSDQEIASPLKLVIVGGADKHHQKYLESLKRLAKDGRRETGDVIFAGPQSKIPECISIADEIVSANTTKPETFGLSVIEAYAMNKPVRAKRFGGVAEVMETVEKSGKPTLREAVISLYAPQLQAARTLAAYTEVK